jgi:hypothetical protein
MESGRLPRPLRRPHKIEHSLSRPVEPHVIDPPFHKDPRWFAGGGLILLGVLVLGYGVELFVSPNVYEAVVRLKVEPDMDGVPANFDPYWLQDQFETLQSKTILYRVITNLDLTQKWA